MYIMYIYITACNRFELCHNMWVYIRLPLGELFDPYVYIIHHVRRDITMDINNIYSCIIYKIYIHPKTAQGQPQKIQLKPLSILRITKMEYILIWFIFYIYLSDYLQINQAKDDSKRRIIKYLYLFISI